MWATSCPTYQYGSWIHPHFSCGYQYGYIMSSKLMIFNSWTEGYVEEQGPEKMQLFCGYCYILTWEAGLVILQWHSIRQNADCDLCLQSTEPIPTSLCIACIAESFGSGCGKRAACRSWHRQATGDDCSLADWWMKARGCVSKSRRKSIDSAIIFIFCAYLHLVDDLKGAECKRVW